MSINLFNKEIFFKDNMKSENRISYMPRNFAEIEFYKTMKFNNLTQVKLEPIAEVPSKVIWIYWHQGIDMAPDIIKMCYNSLLENKPEDVEVIVLNKDNLKDYIDLPQYVYDKVDTNYTHLSDIIRAGLIYLYGGMWLDATYLVLNKIPNEIFEKEFWTISGEFDECYINYKKFFINCFCSKPKNKFNYDLYNLLCNYWKQNEQLCSYYLVDVIILYLYKKNKEYRDMIDSVEISNPYFDYFMIDGLEKPFNAEQLEKIKKDTVFFKTTYKVAYEEDDDSYYNYFKKIYLKEN